MDDFAHSRLLRFEFCNQIGTHYRVHRDTAMYYMLPDPLLIFQCTCERWFVSVVNRPSGVGQRYRAMCTTVWRKKVCGHAWFLYVLWCLWVHFHHWKGCLHSRQVKRWGDTGSMRLKAGIFSCDTTEYASRVGCHNISPTMVVRRGSGLSA